MHFNNKKELINEIDRLIALNNNESINNLNLIFLHLIKEEHHFDLETINFILGYTRLHYKKIPNWKLLKNKIDRIDN